MKTQGPIQFKEGKTFQGMSSPKWQGRNNPKQTEPDAKKEIKK